MVVLPVSKPYRQEFIDEATEAAFEEATSQAMAIVPEATLVRLDRVLPPSQIDSALLLNNALERYFHYGFSRGLSQY